MSGVLVAAGIFSPGTRVELHHAPNDRTLRPGSETKALGARIVDEAGNVGWDDLDLGERYFVEGYVDGVPTSFSGRATDPENPTIAQAPAGLSEPPVGTQQAAQVVPTPELPDEDLKVGVAPGARDTLPKLSEPEQSSEAAAVEESRPSKGKDARPPSKRKRSKAKPPAPAKKPASPRKGAKATGKRSSK